MRTVLCGTLLVGLMALMTATQAEAQGPVERTTAARHGLKRSWFAQLGSPQVTGKLDHVHLHDGLLLVQSGRGVLTALDAETGRTLWQAQVGNSYGASSEPAANEKFVVVLSGSTLYVLDRGHGGILWQRQLYGAPGAGPGITTTHVFVPLVNGMIEGFDLKAGSRQTPWHYHSTGRVLVPPMTTPLSVSWTTERGHFYVADPGAGGIKYRLESRGAIHSRPAAWSPMVYATSVDGLVYAIEETKGDIRWKYSIGEAIYKQPVALADHVFVVPEFGGMYCLNAATGEREWHAPGINQFVSASLSRVYAEDTLGHLAILDITTGVRLGTLPMSARTQKLINGQSDRIYLIDDNCLVQCLHEAQLTSPVLHKAPEPQTEDLRLKPGRPAAEQPEAESMPADDDNPFGAPADDDADNPFAPAGDDDNPFAVP